MSRFFHFSIVFDSIDPAGIGRRNLFIADLFEQMFCARILYNLQFCSSNDQVRSSEDIGLCSNFKAEHDMGKVYENYEFIG